MVIRPNNAKHVKTIAWQKRIFFDVEHNKSIIFLAKRSGNCKTRKQSSLQKADLVRALEESKRKKYQKLKRFGKDFAWKH